MALFPPRPATAGSQATPLPISGQRPLLSPRDTSRAKDLTSLLRAHFAEAVVGQEDLREALITSLIAGGHILIESVPGLAKTTAAQSLAQSVSGSFKRIQCTPDLMPSDLVGTQIFDFSSQRLVTQIGPIHANFVLLDEINRSSAKTQSAMLEAMAEGATTIGGERIQLPRPFMVIATQNPIEEEGTYTLPEAQMDRFFMKTVMTYPSADQERDVLRLLTARGTDTPESDHATAKLSIDDIAFLRSAARQVHVADPIMRFAVDLAATTRGAGSHPIKGLSALVRLGASPRACIAFIRVGQAFALMNGRDYVIPEDLTRFAHEILRHRVLLTFEALADGLSGDDVVDRVLQVVPAP